MDIGALYALLLNPNIVFLLFIVAMLGTYFELAHPGTMVSGAIGGIAFLLFLFMAVALSPNWAGLALMLLAAGLLILDVKLPGHGVLTVVAVVSLVVGALLFFNSGGTHSGAYLNPLVVYGVAAMVGIVGFLLARIALRLHKMNITTGVQGMIGVTVTAKTPLLPEGRVSYGGEDWAAILDDPTLSAEPGSKLQIVSVEGLRLHVQPLGSVLQSDAQAIQTLK